MERREGYPKLDLKQSGNLLRYQIQRSGYSELSGAILPPAGLPVVSGENASFCGSSVRAEPPFGRAYGRSSGRTSGKSGLPGSFWREAVSVFLSETVKPGVVNGCAVSIGLFVQ